ncbi:MAG: ParA family protein [Bacteroidaceae bacterium]|nr:ParA family protein [Bacteroidaceae bacterium]
MKIIAVANQKGGIGKTTTSLALAAGLKRKKKKVLLIDLDPQANATDIYRAEIEGVGTAYDLLVDGDTDCIQNMDAGDIIAGDPNLKDASKLLDGVSAAYKLKKGLASIAPNYDFIIIDTPPALSVLLTNALTAADTVIIPLTSDRFGLHGLVQLNDTIKDIKEFTNPGLTVAGLLLVKYRASTTLAKAVDESLPEYAALLGTKIFDTKIRESIDARKAQAAQAGLYSFAPYCTTARDYDSFIDELLKEEN